MQHTVQSFIEARQETGQMTTVWVRPDADDDRAGNAASARVAAMLAGDDGEIVDVDELDIDEPVTYDVLRFRLPVDRTRLRAVLKHPQQRVNTVVIADDLDERLLNFVDIRVDVPSEGSIGAAVRYRRDDYAGDIYERELAGFTGPAVKTTIVCEDCGHERPTTEENPTLATCHNCGGWNLSYRE